MHVNRRRSGFTLIEVLVTVVIVSILAAFAVPSYRDYATRGRIPEATSSLSAMRVRLEQHYQDNRNYGSTESACGVSNPTSAHFTYTCNWGTGGTDQFFTVTATGVGSMAGFKYTINQSNERRTTAVPTGWGTAPVECWVVKRAGAC